MTKPNFFIVGAPKCGTTALSKYLRDHPNVFMSRPKEPHYFATDMPNYRYVNTESEYLKLFSSVTKSQTVIGEASVFYMYSSTAIENINQFTPNAKIITMLRNPADLVYSMHSQLCYRRQEDQADFNKAWELISERKKGRNIPKHCADVKVLYYDELAQLGKQLERILRYFSKEQVKVIFFGDFIKDTKSIYNEVLQFLNLPNDNRTLFEKINQNKRHRWGWLADIAQHPPKPLLKKYLSVKNTLGIDRIGLRSILLKANLITETRSKMNGELRRKIIQGYKNDIIKLSQLTDRDLNNWLE